MIFQMPCSASDGTTKVQNSHLCNKDKCPSEGNTACKRSDTNLNPDLSAKSNSLSHF